MMMEILKDLWRDESGATAVEYGLIAGIMAAALVTVLYAFKDKLTSLFGNINLKIQDASDNVQNPPNINGG
ncbi:Flp family type IVb pilin [Desulfothermus naphthae]